MSTKPKNVTVYIYVCTLQKCKETNTFMGKFSKKLEMSDVMKYFSQ